MASAKKKDTKSKLSALINPKTGLLILLAAILTLTAWYVIAAKDNATDSLDQLGISQSGPVKKKDSTSSQSPANNSTNNNSNVTKPSNLPFSISKVYFAQVPKQISGPGQGDCHEGDVIKYQATAQITATNKGTAQLHWGTADRLAGTTAQYNTESITFVSSGTKETTHEFSYTVAYNSSPGFPSLQNTLYVNAFVTSPNDIYANGDAPDYAAGVSPPFVWGSWIEFCTGTH